MQANNLPVFPPVSGAVFSGSALLTGRGFRLRSAQHSDLQFMRELYGQLRADELATVPWPAAAKQSFLDSQFELQHRHFVKCYAAADFLIIEHAGAPIGRFYLLHHAEADFLIVDIALVPLWRGKGIGAALIGAAQEEARRCGQGINLHVDQRNTSARRLYERLGFISVEAGGAYQRMKWPAASTAIS